MIFLEGIGFTGYRSFGDELQYIGPFKKVNLFIGQNNSGKSNVLRFLSALPQWWRRQGGLAGKVTLDPIDRHYGAASGELRLAIGVVPSHEHRASLRTSRPDADPVTWDVYERILKSEAVSLGSPLSWFTYRAAFDGDWVLEPAPAEKLIARRILEDAAWQRLWYSLTGTKGGDLAAWVTESLAALSPVWKGFPKVSMIPALRRIGEPGSEAGENDFTGQGIIDRLAVLQNPPYDRQELKTRFESVNRFLREVSGIADARLEIPHGRDMVIVHADRRSLPLSSLGTGIHEVVMLAAAATVLSQQIVGIEEPELHLHPQLQKKLLTYLSEDTSNQYFISTHSAHFMDAPELAIFHVRLKDGRSTVEPRATAAELFDVCLDLGYRASDLLQTNCVIWVEGPSDRIYLRCWIEAVDPTLCEGIHYSIMFYGGRLLSHLTADDPEIAAFISLRRLNRFVAVLIDGDREDAASPLSDTKVRIGEEIRRVGGLAWVTEGRTIENYLSRDVLEHVFKSLHGEQARLGKGGQYARVTVYKDGGGARRDLDKVKLARAVTALPARLDVLDLEERVREVVDFIRKANGIVPVGNSDPDAS